MSQKLIIAIMGAVILAGGGAWYYQTNMADNATGEKSSSRERGDEKSGGLLDAFKEGAGSFADVLKGGAAQECRFAGTDPETKEYSEGTIFIDGESFRLKAETEHSGTKETMNMIQHDKVMYMWSDDEETMPGIKIDMSMFEGVEGEEQPESPIDWLKDPEAGVKYSCKGWSARDDSFEPPEDIEFMDMFGGMGEMFGEMMKNGMAEEGMGEGEWSY